MEGSLLDGKGCDGGMAAGVVVQSLGPSTHRHPPPHRAALRGLFNSSKMSSSLLCLCSRPGSGSWWIPALRGYRG